MRDALGVLGTAGARTLASLVDLVLPGECAGCGAAAALVGAAGPEVCVECARALAVPPGATRPTPAPAGLPICVAGGVYEGPLRELILAYKERGRRGLVAPLGGALGAVVAAGPGLGTRPRPLLLVPVPATAAAVRARRGDHMLRLARRARTWLRHSGWPAEVASPLRALPRSDSAHLGSRDRALAACDAFVVRVGRANAMPRALAETGASVVLLDDVVTTGATLAAAARRLAGVGIPVAFAATLAATRLRQAPGCNQRQTADLPPIV